MIYPIIIFLGIRALTDFGPLLANPVTFLLGAVAQFGVFVAFIGANWVGPIAAQFGLDIGFNIKQAASIAIIGGADGPTSIYLTRSTLTLKISNILIMALFPYRQLPLQPILKNKPFVLPPFYIKKYTIFFGEPCAVMVALY